MLPRPARLLRQCSRIISARRQISSTLVGPAQARIVRRPAHPSIDESFDALIKDDDMGMGMGGGSNPPSKSRSANGRPSDLQDLEVITEAEDTVEKSRGRRPHTFGLNIEPTPKESASSMGSVLPTEGNDEAEYERREERRSPAAVLGSKRIGVVVLPEELKNGIQSQINQLDNPRQLRESYMSLPKSSASKGKDHKVDHRSDKRNPRRTFESELAKAAGVLPGEYGVVRNIMQEMRTRLGNDWLDRAADQAQAARRGEDKQEDTPEVGEMAPVHVVEFTAGLGAGMWATADSIGALSSSTSASLERRHKIQLVHSSRHGLDLAKKVAEGIPGRAVEVMYNRKYVPAETPAVVMSTFLLSTLPTQPSQHAHLQHLLSLDSQYIILADYRTPTGWAAISRARQYLLDQATPETPLHIVAPCPHDGICPLASTRSTCSFSQRIQRPVFTRRTKHSSRGEEDTGYCYVVLARGERPVVSTTAEESLSGLPTSSLGRVGGVGKEEAEKARLKRDGRSVLREVEGHEGVLEMVSLPEGEEGPAEVDTSNSSEGSRAQMWTDMREEAYVWPRLVAPPMKRSGHVTMDACCPDGNIQRLTFSKSHSKQGYHDARKSTWGDLFPHVPKASPVVRTRGLKRLNKPEQDDEGVLEEIMAEEALEREYDLESEVESLRELEELGIEIPRAELAADTTGSDGDGVAVWQTGQASARRREGQRRTFTSSAGRRPSLQVGLQPSLQIRRMSARPVALTTGPRPKVTLSTLNRLSAAKVPISVVTAYDYPTALLAESCGVDMVLVGDSLSQVALGHESTTQITLEEIIHHAKAVTRGAKSPFVFADMPFGSFETSLEQGVANVIRLIKESGIDGVKIEGGLEIVPLVKRLSDIGIPVMPHLGLQPQRATSLSGYLVQGRTAQSAYDIFTTARAMQQAGAFGLLIEAVPRNVARRITEELDVLTIGIGAGNGTDGQVLVVTDVLGVYAQEEPIFVPAQPQGQSQLTQPTPSSTVESADPAQTPVAPENSPLPTSTAPDSTPLPITPTPEILSSGSSVTVGTPLTPDAGSIPLYSKSAHSPRFVRQFGAVGSHARRAVAAYVSAVKDRSFPDPSESYGMKKVEWDGFSALLEQDKRQDAK
ncbi:3-methyl-2-oxobutanoate hydroxymethyltransferase [Kwoniella sp. DSM 27419]